MRVLLTGIAGKLAQQVALELLARGHHVTGIDRRPWPECPAGISLVQTDIRKPDAEEAFRREHPEAVIHMATVSHVTMRRDERYRINLGGTQKVFEYCERHGVPQALFVGRKTGLVYFARSAGAGVSEQQTPTSVFTIAATGGKPREVAKIARGLIGSVNADETLLLGVFAERDFALETGPRDPRFDSAYAAKGPDGKPLTFADAKEVRLDARAEAGIPMEMFTVDLKNGVQKTIHRSTAWLNHLQFSPTDPQLLMFCHEGPWHRVDRIWSMRLGDAQPQLVHRRTMNMEIAGHEFFGVDGRSIWYDLQTPRGEVFWLARANPDGSGRDWFHVERDQWSVHFNVAPDGSFFAGDGGDEEMVAKAKDGKWLYLFRPERIKDVAGLAAPDAEHLIRPGTLRSERLVDLRKHDYRLEPNLIFTPDGKWIVFRSNMHGDAHTYMVEIRKTGSGAVPAN